MAQLLLLALQKLLPLPLLLLQRRAAPVDNLRIMNIYLGLSAAPPPPTVDRQSTPLRPPPAAKQVVRLRRRLHLCRAGARFRTMRHSGYQNVLPSPAAAPAAALTHLTSDRKVRLLAGVLAKILCSLYLHFAVCK